MATRYIKRCSASLIIREMQIKPTVRHHHFSFGPRLQTFREVPSQRLERVVAGGFQNLTFLAGHGCSAFYLQFLFTGGDLPSATLRHPAPSLLCLHKGRVSTVTGCLSLPTPASCSFWSLMDIITPSPLLNILSPDSLFLSASKRHSSLSCFPFILLCDCLQYLVSPTLSQGCFQILWQQNPTYFYTQLTEIYIAKIYVIKRSKMIYSCPHILKSSCLLITTNVFFFFFCYFIF